MQTQFADFTGFTHTQYGKGHLVTPPQSYKFSEDDKYFHGGWWMPAQNGWFFKNSEFDKFLPILTTPKSQKKSASKTKKTTFAQTTTQEVDYFLSKQKQRDFPLKDFQYIPYGRGYHLYISPHRLGSYSFPEDYKYFHGAWWVESQNCWFFREDVLESIRLKGARRHDEEMFECQETYTAYSGDYQDSEHDDFHEDCDEDEDSSEEPDDPNDEDYVDDEDMDDDDDMDDEDEDFVDLRGMVSWEQYGRGWLVKPKNGCRISGQKYLNGGWWMPKKQGWFFRNEEFQFLGLTQ